MISYFIAYSFANETGFGFGNCQIDLQYPIRSQKDIVDVTDVLRPEVPGEPVILSFTRFEDEAGNRAAR
ncbi:hypothetical protein AB0368_25280 [Actinoplanes sp. NPDC051475]|uniref:hypothetical protein n=1 Tax=Actinoplanes sp. NPDC051475 TaxID=3157225 RepID=UPI00344C9D68